MEIETPFPTVQQILAMNAPAKVDLVKTTKPKTVNKRTKTTKTTTKRTTTKTTKRPKKVLGPDTNRAASGRIAYVFTYNDYTAEQLWELQNTVDFIPEVTYIDFGLEKGESGRPHLQGQIEFSKEGI